MFLSWLIPIALGIGAYYFLKHLLRKPLRRLKEKVEQHGKKSAEAEAQRAAQRAQQAKEDAACRETERRAGEERERRRQEAASAKIAQIMKSDPQLAKQMMKMGGVDANRSVEEILNDPQLVRDMAKKLSGNDIEMLRIAAAQQDIEFDLEQKGERDPVPYPTSDIEPIHIMSVDQLLQILPEELVLDDETFYRKFADQELMGLQAYERKVEQKLLYILYDASPSMDEKMQNGLPRHIWARGVILNLLLRAVRGEAKYFLLPFADSPMPLVQVTTPEEAERLIESLCRETPRAGGTRILKALKKATDDIRTLGGEVSQADILLISDGEDDAMKNTAYVQDLLGDDIKLHAALIGPPSEFIQQVSTSYRVFR